MEKLTELKLETLAGGAALELFDRELQEVLKNIQDPNTEAEKARAIHVKVTLSPSEDRDRADVALEVKSKLAPPKPVKSLVHMGEKDGRLVAVSYDPRQSDLFRETDEGIVPIERAEKEAQ